MARRLKSAGDLRRYLAWLIRAVEKDEIDTAKGGKLGYLASILLKCIEGSEIEKRLEEVERQLKEDNE